MTERTDSSITGVSTSTTMVFFGWLLIGASVVVALVLGSKYKVINVDEDKVFNWVLAAVSFAPLFVAGVILVVASTIIDRID